jgi:general secretion pathway protein G
MVRNLPGPITTNSEPLGQKAIFVVVVAVRKVASMWSDFKRAGEPTPLTITAQLRAAALQLRFEGFTGCPTVQQVLESSLAIRHDIQQATNGIDPWGMPYQLECAKDQVRVFSMGPDKRAGTGDDISWTP